VSRSFTWTNISASLRSIRPAFATSSTNDWSPGFARTFYGSAGDAADIAVEMERYADLLKAHRPIACIMGIGENGHLAFNDPPADFTTRRIIHLVSLVESCRQQQVGEGHFARLDDVPRQAISLTVPALLTPPHILVIAPEARKAAAVRAALEDPITPDCPASILRTAPHARLYLDRDSAALLGGTPSLHRG